MEGFWQLGEKAGRSLWLRKSWLTESEVYPMNLLAHWKMVENEPWCLTTNLPDMQPAILARLPLQGLTAFGQ